MVEHIITFGTFIGIIYLAFKEDINDDSRSTSALTFGAHKFIRQINCQQKICVNLEKDNVVNFL